MVRQIICVAITTLLVTGCSHLVLKDDDTTAEKSGKVATRVVLGIATLGLSELEISNAKKKIEALKALDAYRENLNRWIQEGKLTVFQAELLYRTRVNDVNSQLAGQRNAGDVLMAIGAGLSMAGQSMQNTSSSYSAPPPPQIIHCITSRIGNTLFTNCY